MAEYSAPATLTTPGPDLTFNAPTGDTYILDAGECTGLDGGPIRRTIEDAPMTDGALVFPSRKAGRPIFLVGWLRVRSAITEAGVVAARSVLENNMRLALEAIENADGTYAWVPSGGSRSLTVQCDIPAVFPGGFVKRFQFGLIAADPTW